MKKLTKETSASEGQGHSLDMGSALVLALAVVIGIMYVLASLIGQGRRAATETDVSFW
jgi:flagellar biogenesis protein FliO